MWDTICFTAKNDRSGGVEGLSRPKDRERRSPCRSVKRNAQHMRQSSFEPFVVVAKNFHVQRVEGESGRRIRPHHAKQLSDQTVVNKRFTMHAVRVFTSIASRRRLERSMQYSADER